MTDQRRLRAAAQHASMAAAAALGLKFEGEAVAPREHQDWLDMLVYVADPF